MYKIIALLTAFATFSLNAFPASPLKSGTYIGVRITSGTNSNTNIEPTAIVTNNVQDENGNILIRQGTPVTLQTEKEKSRGCGAGGFMRIKCVSTTAVDGQYVNLSGGISIAGEDKTGLAVGLGVGLGVTLLPGVGFALLAIKGEKANIESGTIIPNAVILGDYYINAQ